ANTTPRKIADLQHGSDWQVITWRHHRLRARAENRTVPLAALSHALMHATDGAGGRELPWLTTKGVDLVLLRVFSGGGV
ncbi:hypothetical protein ACFWY5_44395, partial [Nonomuraea sp. NPDC059007]|uniref:hypothetical protein n=1 Tax=Nonomuraea sp. NPDC059007 TaxID=3346692 RepID=UPI0036B5ECD2